MTHVLSAAAYAPYGDVTYADNGMRADKKKRYPLDSQEHCRAAWSYISMPKNAKFYTADQLATIKSRIKAAGKRYGITFAEDVKAAALPDVELARPGTWHLSSGKRTFTTEMLRDAAEFYAAAGNTRVPFGFGHTDPRFDGDPAFGWVSNIRYDEDDEVLLGDLVDMEDWLAAAAPQRWPNRSVEGFVDLEFNGRTYGLALTRVALLGATPPAMPNLKSMADMRQAIAAAAASSGAEFVAATAGDPDEHDDPELDETDEDNTVDELAEETPALEAEESQPEGAGMNLAKYREVLAGLPDDASEEEISEALVEAGFDVGAPVPIPVAASGASQQEIDQRIAAAAARGGVVTIDAATVHQFQEGMLRASALAARLDGMDRDTTITGAIAAGKFPPARREHYERSWKHDPEGTRELIGSLAAGLVPVTASGYSGDTDPAEDDLDREIARLSPPIRVSAREGA